MKHPQIDFLKTNLRHVLTARGIYMRMGSRRGFDAESDLLRASRDEPVRVIFDVGANVGQSALAYARTFSQAHIWSFEPFPETREHFLRNTSKFADRITLRPEAMSREKGTARFAATDLSVLNHIIDDEKQGAPKALEEIEVSTMRIDAFCAEHGIKHIDFLKIDTEGSDLQALEGASHMLDQKSIRFLQVEAGMADVGKIQVPMEEFFAFLRPFGYDTFGVYEQLPGAGTDGNILRRANVVFARKEN